MKTKKNKIMAGKKSWGTIKLNKGFNGIGETLNELVEFWEFNRLDGIEFKDLKKERFLDLYLNPYQFYWVLDGDGAILYRLDDDKKMGKITK